MVNRIELLSFMLGATDTTKYPELAPVGIVIVIEVALHEFTVATVPLNKTVLLPCVDPNPVPVMVTWLPTEPVVADTPEMTGAEAEEELRDTLSNVAVYVLLVLPLLTPSPTYTFVAMLMLWLEPTCSQFSPSDDIHVVKVLPLRTNFSQYGTLTDTPAPV
jgi:hypothetical protein